MIGFAPEMGEFGIGQSVKRFEDVRLLRGEGREASVNSRGTHILTPETATSCHYFYGSSRNFGLDDPAIDEVLRAWQAQALNQEDKLVVEAIERRARYVRGHGLRPAMLACDEAAVRVAREIERLERLEDA